MNHTLNPKQFEIVWIISFISYNMFLIPKGELHHLNKEAPLQLTSNEEKWEVSDIIVAPKDKE